MFTTRRALGKVLLFAEFTGGKVSPATYAAVTAAKALGDVTALAAGPGSKAIAEQLKAISGVSQVLVAEAPHYDHFMPEEIAPLVVENVKKGGFTHVVAASSAISKGFIPRAAAKFDSMPVTDVTKVEGENKFVRLTYAGNAVTTVSTSDSVKFLTIRPTSFDKAPATGGSGSVADATATAAVGSAAWVQDIIQKSDKPELTAAPVVVSGGRGLKNGDNFKLLHELAEPLKGAVGATRAVVDAGYCPNDMQVGQTGKVVAPNLYVAVGLSGAIQHVAGMKDSKVIVAINTDPDAPIFSVSDYGLVEDLFKAVPEMTKQVKS
jgi:electron transfer flavoprotein alpha subunit